MTQLEKDLAVLHHVENEILQAGESIVWKGRPDPVSTLLVDSHRTFGRIAVMAFACYWAFQVADFGIISLIALVFIGIALLQSLGPLRNYARANNSYYAVTTRRVLIVTASDGITVTEIAPDAISQLRIKDKGDGTGNITLNATIARGDKSTWLETRFENGLWGIQDLKGAADAITALRTA